MICLNQAIYAQKILETFKMDEWNTSNTLIEADLKFKYGRGFYEKSKKWWSHMGSLRYLNHTRIDLRFSVWYLTCLEKPTLGHVKAT